MKLGRYALCAHFMIRLASPFHPTRALIHKCLYIAPRNQATRARTTAWRSAHGGESQSEDTVEPLRVDSRAAYFDAHCHVQLAGASAATQALQGANKDERLALMSVGALYLTIWKQHNDDLRLCAL
jgi:hypothetical protein